MRELTHIIAPPEPKAIWRGIGFITEINGLKYSETSERPITYEQWERLESLDAMTPISGRHEIEDDERVYLSPQNEVVIGGPSRTEMEQGKYLFARTVTRLDYS